MVVPEARIYTVYAQQMVQGVLGHEATDTRPINR